MDTVASAPIATSGMPTLRIGGWLLIAAALSFISALVILVAFDSEYQEAIVAAAKASDTTIMTIPAEEQARLAVEHQTLASWVSLVLLLMPNMVLILAVHQIRASMTGSDTEQLLTAAWRLVIASAGFWYFFALLSALLALGPDRLPPLVAQIDVIGVPLVSVAALCGVGAMLCAGLAMRRSSVSPRAGLAVVIISSLLAVVGVVTVIASGFTMDLPPIVPFLPALILGIALLRATRS